MLARANLKAQARQLVSALAAHEGPVRYQDALELLAQLNGHRTWHVMSAAFDKAPVPREAVTEAAYPILQAEGRSYAQTELPGSGFLFRVPVSVDTSMTAVVLVRATDKDEAVELARSLVAEGKAPMEVDDGNYRGPGDYYCPDQSDNSVFRLTDDFAQASVHESISYQAGAFVVELTDLGDGDDGLLWADLTVFSPEEEEGVSASVMSCVPASASSEEAREFCKELATLLHVAAGDVRTVDYGRIDHAFTRAAQAGMTQETKDFVTVLLRH